MQAILSYICSLKTNFIRRMQQKLTRRIFLIGFMGSGKSSLGKKLAGALQYDFVDTDKMIAAAAGKSVADIFAQEGEAFFREKERETLAQLAERENVVVSTGGGMACFYDNIALMNRLGVTIYLEAEPKLLARRLEKRKDERPLLRSTAQEDLDKFIAEILQKRESFYRQADLTLPARNLTAQAVLSALKTEFSFDT